MGGLMNVTMSAMVGLTKTARYFITKSMIRIHSVSTDNLKHAIILQTLDLSEQVDMEGRLERWKRKYIVLPSVFQRFSRIP